jgi:hypothetical protein
MTGADAERIVAQEPKLVEQAEFELNIDYYVEAAESGQEFWLMRNGAVVCHLGPAER